VRQSLGAGQFGDGGSTAWPASERALRRSCSRRDRYKARKTGSMFSGGAPTVGVTVEKLLEAQAR
jgi:hypothetical protein